MTINETISDMQLLDLRHKYKDNGEVSWIISYLTAIKQEHDDEIKHLNTQMEFLREQRDDFEAAADYEKERVDMLKIRILELRELA